VILLISGVYYSVDVLPGWLQPASDISPATYILDGIRAALIDGASIGELRHEFIALTILGAVLVPASLLIFAAAERWAKQTGKLKRQG
jgi:ABC-2 type transport system permease protein